LKGSEYRLGEYKIVEYEDGELSWESHFGFAALREGRCFVKGKILFLGPWFNEEAGFFKREYRDHLRKLPRWTKTEYYILHFKIYNCQTGEKVSQEELRRAAFREAIQGTRKPLEHPGGSGPQENAREVSYALNRYEMVKKQEGEVLWKSYAGLSGIKSGKGFIMEDIVFLGPAENEEPGLSKKSFLGHLDALARWNQTRYFCNSFEVYECESGKSMRQKNHDGEPGVPLQRQESPGNDNVRTWQEAASRFRKGVIDTLDAFGIDKNTIGAAFRFLIRSMTSLGVSIFTYLKKATSEWKRKTRSRFF
jgi:hypothetical protein